MSRHTEQVRSSSWDAMVSKENEPKGFVCVTQSYQLNRGVTQRREINTLIRLIESVIVEAEKMSSLTKH